MDDNPNVTISLRARDCQICQWVVPNFLRSLIPRM